MKRLVFRLACPPIIAIGETQAWLAAKVRTTTGTRQTLALAGWAPTRALYVGLYRCLAWLHG